jgi:hypothetical protein
MKIPGYSMYLTHFILREECALATRTYVSQLKQKANVTAEDIRANRGGELLRIR